MPRFRPTLTVLDGRALPSASVTEAAGVLTVRGSADDEMVAIIDDGTAAAGNVSVETDDAVYTAAGAIHKIRVFMGAGYDDVSYTLTGDLAAAATRSVMVRLGGDDDFFTADLDAGLRAGARLDLAVQAGVGDDTLSVVGGLVNVAAGAELSLNFRAGEGEDSVSAFVAGLITGRVELEMYGGAGDDSLDGDLTADGGSTGAVAALVRTGAGYDFAGLSLTADDASGLVSAGDDDEVYVSDNVRVG